MNGFYHLTKNTAKFIELYESSEAITKTMGATSESESDENPDYPYQITKLEVLGNVSGELREKLDAIDSPVDYWTYLDGLFDNDDQNAKPLQLEVANVRTKKERSVLGQN